MKQIILSEGLYHIEELLFELRYDRNDMNLRSEFEWLAVSAWTQIAYLADQDSPLKILLQFFIRFLQRHPEEAKGNSHYLNSK